MECARLLQISNECNHESKELLINELKDLREFVSEIRELCIEQDIKGIIAAYQNAGLTTKDYRQYATVNNPHIDSVFRRYMLEAAIKNITVDCHVESLENISSNLAVKVADSIKHCFEEIFQQPNESHIFLSINTQNNGVILSATIADVEFFSQTVKESQPLE